MELKLEDGKYLPGRESGVSEVSGIPEVLQRVYMKLKAPRGRFPLLPDYGSRLYMLPSAKPSERALLAEKYVLEALGDEQGLELISLELTDVPDGGVLIRAEFRAEGGTFIVEQAIGDRL